MTPIIRHIMLHSSEERDPDRKRGGTETGAAPDRTVGFERLEEWRARRALRGREFSLRWPTSAVDLDACQRLITATRWRAPAPFSQHCPSDFAFASKASTAPTARQ